MKDQPITFKTAKLAKEKGLIFPMSDSFYKGELQWSTPYINLNDVDQVDMYFNGVAKGIRHHAPRKSELQKYLRDVYEIIVEINLICVGENEVIQYKYVVLHHYKTGNHIKEICKEMYFNSYEEALEEGLYSALEFLSSAK